MSTARQPIECTAAALHRSCTYRTAPRRLWCACALCRAGRNMAVQCAIGVPQKLVVVGGDSLALQEELCALLGTQLSVAPGSSGRFLPWPSAPWTSPWGVMDSRIHHPQTPFAPQSAHPPLTPRSRLSPTSVSAAWDRPITRSTRCTLASCSTISLHLWKGVAQQQSDCCEGACDRQQQVCLGDLLHQLLVRRNAN